MARLSKPPSVIAIFSEFFKQYPRQFGLLFLLLVVEGAVAIVSVLALVPLADFMLDNSLTKPSRITEIAINGLSTISVPTTFWTLAALFLFSTFFRASLEVAIRYAILRIKYAVSRGLVGDALQTFFKSRWEFFSGSEQGRLLNSLNRELVIIGDTLGHIATFFAQIVHLGIYLALPLWLNAQLTLIALGLAILFGSPFLLLNGISYRLGKLNTETANIAMGILTEALGAARLILGFGWQKQVNERYLAAFDEHTKVTLRSQVLGSAVPKFFQPMAMLAIIIALGFAVERQGHISELAAVMWSLLSAMPILSAVLQTNISISNFLPSYEQLSSLRSRAAELEEVQGGQAFSKLKFGIELINLSFTYHSRTKTLTNLNLQIRKGQMTALIGESGSGKSTVTDLVLGLQIPEIGQVLIDGVPFGDWNQNSFRERVGYVPQDPQLFHASIRDNMLWAFNGARECDIWDALQLANAADFVKELPLGLDTIVGDRGIRLSGGQRQRIALARALLRDPELLILDEATSSLDTDSERLIQQSIHHIAQSKTILIVAHRLSTVAKANQVYVLHQGRVVEEGSFFELSARHGGILNTMLIQQSQFNEDEIIADLASSSLNQKGSIKK